jgi:hypothetical protein
VQQIACLVRSSVFTGMHRFFQLNDTLLDDYVAQMTDPNWTRSELVLVTMRNSEFQRGPVPLPESIPVALVVFGGERSVVEGHWRVELAATTVNGVAKPDDAHLVYVGQCHLGIGGNLQVLVSQDCLIEALHFLMLEKTYIGGTINLTLHRMSTTLTKLVSSALLSVVSVDVEGDVLVTSTACVLYNYRLLSLVNSTTGLSTNTQLRKTQPLVEIVSRSGYTQASDRPMIFLENWVSRNKTLFRVLITNGGVETGVANDQGCTLLCILHASTDSINASWMLHLEVRDSSITTYGVAEGAALSLISLQDASRLKHLQWETVDSVYWLSTIRSNSSLWFDNVSLLDIADTSVQQANIRMDTLIADLTPGGENASIPIGASTAVLRVTNTEVRNFSFVSRAGALLGFHRRVFVASNTRLLGTSATIPSANNNTTVFLFDDIRVDCLSLGAARGWLVPRDVRAFGRTSFGTSAWDRRSQTEIHCSLHSNSASALSSSTLAETISLSPHTTTTTSISSQPSSSIRTLLVSHTRTELVTSTGTVDGSVTQSLSPRTSSLSDEPSATRTHPQIATRSGLLTVTETASGSASPQGTTTVSARATETLLPSPTATLPVPPPDRRDPVIEDDVSRPTQTSVVASALGSGVAMNPAVGMAVYRSSLLLALINCDVDLQEPLDGATSPTKMRLGEEHLQYVRGAAVGNTLLAAAFCVATAAAVAVRRELGPRPRMPWRVAAADLALPGWLVVPLSVLVQPQVTVGVMLVSHGGPRDVVGGSLCIAFIAGCTLFAMVNLTLRFRSRAVLVPNDDEEGGKPKAPNNNSMSLAMLGSFVHAVGATVAATTSGRTWTTRTSRSATACCSRCTAWGASGSCASSC